MPRRVTRPFAPFARGSPKRGARSPRAAPHCGRIADAVALRERDVSWGTLRISQAFHRTHHVARRLQTPTSSLTPNQGGSRAVLGCCFLHHRVGCCCFRLWRYCCECRRRCQNSLHRVSRPRRRERPSGSPRPSGLTEEEQKESRSLRTGAPRFAHPSRSASCAVRRTVRRALSRESPDGGHHFISVDRLAQAAIEAIGLVLRATQLVVGACHQNSR